MKIAGTTAKPWRICLAGAGHVGGNFLDLLHDRHHEIAARYGIDLRVTGVAEIGGCALDPDGLDLAALLARLTAREPLETTPGVGRTDLTARQLLVESGAALLLDATPVNLADGEPGLGLVRAALRRGMHVVLADKGPLALAYSELADLSDLAAGWGARFAGAPQEDRPRLRFSATVAGALPVINMGRRDLAGDGIAKIEAVLNGTTQSILRAMEDGFTFDEALASAQERGIAETDPTLDVEGHDAACKLVIAANAVLGLSATLADVEIMGVTKLSRADMTAALAHGNRLVLMCTADRVDEGYRLSVRPSQVPGDHPLARLTPDEMGVVFYSDHVDRLSSASLEPGPGPAAAAMLRDILDIVWSEECTKVRD